MATFASAETTFRNIGKPTLIPPHDVCRLSYYLRSVTLSCGIDIIADDLVDYQNANNLSQARADSIFKLAATDFKVDVVLNKIIFHDEDGDLCGDRNNSFLEVTNVTNILSVQNQILIGGKVKNVSKVMVFRKPWLEKFYYEPLRRNEARVQRVTGSRDPVLLLAQLLSSITVEEVNDEGHCSHCKGKDGPCACKSSCSIKSSTKCSAIHHCTHCKGISEDTCACKEGCLRPEYVKCVVVHNIICDACKTQGVQGTRYKCADCFNYDLCSKCYSSGEHEKTHAFKRIDRVGSTPEALVPRQPVQGQNLLRFLRPNSATKKATASKATPPTSTSDSNAGKFVGDDMSVSEMKAYLQENGVSAATAVEKHDLKKLVWETQIEGMGSRELDAFMDARGITRDAKSSVGVRRTKAIAAFPVQERPPAPAFPVAGGGGVLATGQTVKLCRLRKADMNGMMADVVRSEVIDGKVKIQLLGDTQKQYEIKPENLDIVSEVLE